MTFPFTPKIAGWELTRRCNYRCIHCGTSCGAPREDEMTLEEAYKMIDDLGELGCQILTLSGGEPLMHPHWDKFAIRLKERGITPFMITNGYYIKENIERILATPLRRIGLSIDGPESVHNYIRQRPDAYRIAMDAAKLLHENGIEVGAVSHASRYNLEHLEEMYQEFRKVPFDFWQIQITFLSGRMKEHETGVLRPEELPLVAKFVEEKRQAKEMMVCAGDNLGYYSQFDICDTPWKGCHAGRFVIGIEADGHIKGCLSLPEYFREDSIRNRSLKEIWTDREMFKLNRYFNPDDMSGSCKGCLKAKSCRGGCKVTAYCSTGNIYDNPYCLYRVEREAALKTAQKEAESHEAIQS